MKSVDFDTFVQLPPGILFHFQDEDPNCIREDTLCVKGETLTPAPGEPISDFYYTTVGAQEFVGPRGCRVYDDGPIFTRWGEFDYKNRYLVLEPKDLAELTETVRHAHEVYPLHL